MPIHLRFVDYMRIGQVRLKGMMGMNKGPGGVTFNDVSVKSLVHDLRKTGQLWRVREYRSPQKLREALDTVIQSGQMSADDAPWFAPGTDTMQLLDYVCTQGSVVSLIFKSGVKQRTQAFLPDTNLKRIEIHDHQGGFHVVWERWKYLT